MNEAYGWSGCNVIMVKPRCRSYGVVWYHFCLHDLRTPFFFTFFAFPDFFCEDRTSERYAF